MRYTVLIARFLLGAMFVVFGLNTVLWSCFDAAFMQPPEEMPEAAAALMAALDDARFMHPLRGGAELLGGLMVLSGLFLPLGLMILAPVIVHIVLYHHFVDTTGLGFSYVILALFVFLVFAHLDAFRGVLRARSASRWATPNADTNA